MLSSRLPPRPAATLGALVAVALAYGVWRWLGRGDSPPGGGAESAAASGSAEDHASVSIEARATAFCGGCHRMPNPVYFTQDRWHEEVERGFRFHAVSMRTDLSAPPLRDVADYFRVRAPKELKVSQPPNDAGDAVEFAPTPVGPAEGSSTRTAAISFLRYLQSEAGEAAVLLACDMGSGELLAIDPETRRTRAIASVGHPAHVEPCDLDSDGATDLVVADLGSFLPEDHDRGRVVWLRRTAAGYEQVVLLDGVGRVADARAGDFDGDGDEDLVVAEFGWQKTGGVHLLVNESVEGGPRFRRRLLDDRHGPIHVPVLDWDADGRADFLALVSQEHETVELFLSGRDGFRREFVSPPEDPAFGSSGIEPVDLDGDGDRDVLYTNGDTFDSYELKPHHGIQWAENRGAAGWVTHRLTAMPGVHRALAEDLDGDGDRDVAAVAMLPERLFGGNRSAAEFDSVIWLEQVGPGEFVRHGIERGSCHHAAMEVGDFDGDGRVDVAVGDFQKPGSRSPVTIWRNLVAAPLAAEPGAP